MITFERFNTREVGRLGNQLFQYAYLRTQARRLGVRFFCRAWAGDEAFTLDDGDERAAAPEGVTQHYRAPWGECGFVPEAEAIADGTDVDGFFQSPRYFAGHEDEVRRWFAPRPSVQAALDDYTREHLGGLDVSSAVSLSLRIDDDYRRLRRRYPLYPLSYYAEALERLPDHGPVMVFSDRPDRARRFFAGLRVEPHFVDGLEPPAALHLMARCRDHVITNSTFAWWGAWLNGETLKRVVTPQPWFRPGDGVAANELIPPSWLEVPALPGPQVPRTYWVVRDAVVEQAGRLKRRALPRRRETTTP